MKRRRRMVGGVGILRGEEMHSEGGPGSGGKRVRFVKVDQGDNILMQRLVDFEGYGAVVFSGEGLMEVL